MIWFKENYIYIIWRINIVLKIYLAPISSFINVQSGYQTSGTKNVPRSMSSSKQLPLTCHAIGHSLKYITKSWSTKFTVLNWDFNNKKKAFKT